MLLKFSYCSYTFSVAFWYMNDVHHARWQVLLLDLLAWKRNNMCKAKAKVCCPMHMYIFLIILHSYDNYIATRSNDFMQRSWIYEIIQRNTRNAIWYALFELSVLYNKSHFNVDMQQSNYFMLHMFYLHDSCYNLFKYEFK